MPRLELTGQRFGRLTVNSFAYVKDYRTYWNCQCDCGNQCIIMGKYLTNGDTKSCGCLNIDRIKEMGRNNKKSNDYYIDDQNTVHVKLSNANEEMLCDLDDWEKLKKYTWYLNNNGYVRAYSLTEEEREKSHFLYHTQIMPTDDNHEIDHISLNKLDNRKSNLRVVNICQNMQNRGLFKNNTSGHTGVYWNKRNQKWGARINVSRKSIDLGSYKNKEDAIKAREEAEIKYFGEFRRVENREEDLTA